MLFEEYLRKLDMNRTDDVVDRCVFVSCSSRSALLDSVRLMMMMISQEKIIK